MNIVDRRNAARKAQRPDADARGLPNHFFTDPDHFRLEQRRLFRRNWTFAGVTEEVAREAMRLAAHKLPIPCRFVEREEA